MFALRRETVFAAPANDNTEGSSPSESNNGNSGKGTIRADMALFSCDLRGNFTACDQTFTQLFGYAPEQLRGKTFDLLFSLEGHSSHEVDAKNETMRSAEQLCHRRHRFGARTLSRATAGPSQSSDERRQEFRRPPVAESAPRRKLSPGRTRRLCGADRRGAFSPRSFSSQE